MIARSAFLVGLLFLATAGSTSAAYASDANPFPITPQADETVVDSDGNAQTDALLECYAKFRGLDEKDPGVGQPHIAQQASGDYILRADLHFKGANAETGRLICSKIRFKTEKHTSDAPLDASYPATADAGTQRLIDGWVARRKADALQAATASRFPPPDADAIRTLEGVWLIGRKPENGPCLSHWYLETEIEFEFQKTGGRALIFEPYDLFTSIAISGVERSGDILSLQGESRDGGLRPFMRLRIVTPTQLEIVPNQSGATSSQAGTTQYAYRCGEPNHSVDASVSFDKLSAIVPALSGGGALRAVLPGVSDADICQGRGLTSKQAFEAKWLQLEFYGPDHYWVFGAGFGPDHKLSFDFIRSIQSDGDHTLKLQMQQHLEAGEGWDVDASRGKIYQLTIIDHGSRIEIPELNTEFVHCKANDPANIGMHRW